MITGLVLRRAPLIELTIHGTRRRRVEITAVVDSGFTGRLTLPRTIITRLGLRRRGEGRCILADGSVIVFSVFEARVLWDGQMRRIRVEEADIMPLVGMSLLAGFAFNMQVRSRGKVTITRLPA